MKVSKLPVAGLLLCSQVVHLRQEARQGRRINNNNKTIRMLIVVITIIITLIIMTFSP